MIDKLKELEGLSYSIGDLHDTSEESKQRLEQLRKEINESIKLQELVKKRIKVLDEFIQEQVKLITDIQNEMVEYIIGFRHERFEEQISNHQGVINILKDEMKTLQSLVDESEKSGNKN